MKWMTSPDGSRTAIVGQVLRLELWQRRAVWIAVVQASNGSRISREEAITSSDAKAWAIQEARRLLQDALAALD